MSTIPLTPALRPLPMPDFPRHRRSGLTLSMHYFTSSIVWSAVLIGVLAIWYAVEKYGLALKGSPMRMVADPTEFAVRIAGLAHFIIAGMFLATSPRLRTPGGWLWLTGLAAAAVVQCWMFAAAGGRDNPLALILFYMYFMIHAFRDEAFFYRIRAGKAVTPEPHTESVIRWLQVLALCVLLGLLTAAVAVRQPLGYDGKQDNALRALFPADWPFVAVFAATVTPLAILATLAFQRIESRQPGGFWGLVRTHGPLTRVIGWTVAIMLASMVVGAWTYNFVIVMHFVAWFEFTTVKIRSLPTSVRQSATPRRPLTWFKTSLTGFCVLHVGLSLLFLGLIAINHYALVRQPLAIAGQTWANPLELLFSAQNLYFWTIAHVTLSFYPRPIPKT
jgi:hypothetical protein